MDKLKTKNVLFLQSQATPDEDQNQTRRREARSFAVEGQPRPPCLPQSTPEKKEQYWSATNTKKLMKKKINK